MSDPVNHPDHYKGAGGLEAIDVIEKFALGYHLGNTIKYVLRAGKKGENNAIQDLEKAKWYLSREISRRKAAESAYLASEREPDVLGECRSSHVATFDHHSLLRTIFEDSFAPMGTNKGP